MINYEAFSDGFWANGMFSPGFWVGSQVEQNTPGGGGKSGDPYLNITEDNDIVDLASLILLSGLID